MGVLGNLSNRLQGDPVQKAFRLRDRGKTDPAIDSLDRYLHSHPDHLGSALHLAAFLMEEDRMERAAEVLRQAFKFEPSASQEIHILVDQLRIPRDNHWPIHLIEAEGSIQRGELSEGLSHLESIPTDTREGLEDRYRTRFHQSIPKDPSQHLHPKYLLSAYLAALAGESLGKVQEALEIYRIILARNPNEKENVARRFEALLATDYRNLELRIDLGELYCDFDQIDRAVQEFSLVIELEPSAAEILVPRLQSLIDKGKDHHAIRWIHLQASAFSGCMRETIDRVRALTDQGHYIRESIQLLERCLKISFDSETALLIAHLFLKFGRTNEAMEWIERSREEAEVDRLAQAYEEVIQARPDSPAAYLKLADIRLNQDKAEMAMTLFHTLMTREKSHDSMIISRLRGFVDKNRNSAGAQRILAELLFRNGEPEKGVIVLRHILRIRSEQDPEFLELFRKLLQQRPEDHRLRLGMAEALAAGDKLPEALRELAILVKRAPELAPEFLHLLSDLSSRSRELGARSLEIFDHLLPAGIHQDAVWFGRAMATAAAGNPQEALERLVRMIRKWPERHKEVEAGIRRISATNPDAPAPRYALVEMAIRRRDFRSATTILQEIRNHDPKIFPRILKFFTAAVSKFPDNIDARRGLSTAYLVGRFFQRILTLGKETLGIADDESTAGFRIDMGTALMELGELSKAARMYLSAFQGDKELAGMVRERIQSLIRIDNTIGGAHLALGVVALGLGHLEEGITAFLEAWRQDPDQGETILQNLEKLCSLNPTIPSIPLAMATILHEKGEGKKAVQMLGELLDCTPRVADQVAELLKRIQACPSPSAQGWFQLGRALEMTEETHAACEAFQKAFRLDILLSSRILISLRAMARTHPGDSVVCGVLGSLCAVNGKDLEAAKWFQRAIEKAESGHEKFLQGLEDIAQKNPENAQIILILGTEYGRKGHLDKAIPCYETALAFEDRLHQEIRICTSNFIETEAGNPAAFLVRCRAWALGKRPQEALNDLKEAAKHWAALHKVLAAALDLHRRFPDHCETLLFLLDLLLAEGKLDQASTLLEESAGEKWKSAEKIALLLRRWRVANAQGNGSRARESLKEAESITPDRNRLLQLIHGFLVQHLKLQCRALEETIREKGEMEKLPELIRILVELGECERAQEWLAENRQNLGHEKYCQLAAMAYIRQGLPFRALEPLGRLDPTLQLSLAAEKCRNLPLAAAAMERLINENPDPVLEKRLEAYYQAMTLNDLRRSSETLVGETILSYPG